MEQDRTWEQGIVAAGYAGSQCSRKRERKPQLSIRRLFPFWYSPYYHLVLYIIITASLYQIWTEGIQVASAKQIHHNGGKQGQLATESRWYCQSRDCNWSFVAQASEAGAVPHCVCGIKMKKGDTVPAFHYLDFLREETANDEASPSEKE